MIQENHLFRSSSIGYSHGGAGNHLLICFHGYGETGQSFHFLEAQLPRDYRILTLDLPYHGTTTWEEKTPLHPRELANLLQEIIVKQDWQYVTITLLGYSIGARLCFGLLQQEVLPVHKIVLLAPDGIPVHFWYRLATQTKMGKRIFARTLRNPGLFLFILSVLHSTGLLHPAQYRFIHQALDTAQNRHLLYLRWTSLQQFVLTKHQRNTLLLKKALPVNLLYGSRDRVTRPEKGQQFIQQISPWGSCTIIPGGHDLLKEANQQVIWKQILV